MPDRLLLPTAAPAHTIGDPFSQELSPPRLWQALAAKALGEGLRIFRLAEAEHDEILVIALEVIWPRRDRQSIGKAAHSLVIHNATHLFSGKRNVVRPFAHDIGAADFASAARHPYRTAISFVAGCLNSTAAF